MKEKLFLMLLFCQLAKIVLSQDLEPRVYANLPTGTNAVALVYGYSTGNVLTDPSKPIAGAKLNAHNIGLGYVRTFGLFNKLARIQIALPYSTLVGKATINGKDTGATRSGFGDTRVRFGMNFTGSPALKPADFRRYEQKTIIGMSLVFSVPTGLYHKDKLINLGSNRWAIKPELGLSHRFKHFYAEVYGGVWFYTDNNAFLTNKVQKQEPVFSFQAHLCYYFKNGMWIGVNGNWFNGGKTFVDNSPYGDLQDNWRMGGTFSTPIAKQHSLKLQFHVGAFTSTGYDYNVISLAYQYVFFSKK